MAYSKRELIKFLYYRKDELINQVNSEYHHKSKKFKLALMERHLGEEINNYFSAVQLLKDRFNKLIDKAGKIEGVPFSINYYCYGSILRVTSDLPNNINNFTESLLDDMNFSENKTLIQMGKKADQLTDEINKNYNNLIITCKQMPSGKKVAEYLISLGFDLSEFEDNEICTALTKEVDLNYIFTPKEMEKIQEKKESENNGTTNNK